MEKKQKEPAFKEYTVGGYTFKTKEAAQAAKDELAAIKYMSAKTDNKDPKQVYLLYNSIIEKQLFNTLVGMNYLKELQQFLYCSEEVPNEKIQPIPINQGVKELIEGKRELIEKQSELRKLTVERNKYKDRFVITTMINIVLVVVMIVILFITLNSKNPNIINYEVNIQNKYALWQEQLQSQEASIKARERQLEQK